MKALAPVAAFLVGLAFTMFSGLFLFWGSENVALQAAYVLGVPSLFSWWVAKRVMA